MTQAFERYLEVVSRLRELDTSSPLGPSTDALLAEHAARLTELARLAQVDLEHVPIAAESDVDPAAVLRHLDLLVHTHSALLASQSEAFPSQFLAELERRELIGGAVEAAVAGDSERALLLLGRLSEVSNSAHEASRYVGACAALESSQVPTSHRERVGLLRQRLAGLREVLARASLKDMGECSRAIGDAAAFAELWQVRIHSLEALHSELEFLDRCHLAELPMGAARETVAKFEAALQVGDISSIAQAATDLKLAAGALRSAVGVVLEALARSGTKSSLGGIDYLAFLKSILSEEAT